MNEVNQLSNLGNIQPDTNNSPANPRVVVCWANGCAGNFTASEPRMRAFSVLAHECTCHGKHKTTVK